MESITKFFWLIPLCSVIGLVFAYIFFKSMMKEDEGTNKMKEIAKHVREGAMAYLSRQYRVVGLVFVVLLIILTILAYLGNVI